MEINQYNKKCQKTGNKKRIDNPKDNKIDPFFFNNFGGTYKESEKIIATKKPTSERTKRIFKRNREAEKESSWLFFLLPTNSKHKKKGLFSFKRRKMLHHGTLGNKISRKSRKINHGRYRIKK
jgi:hypothetical protein